MQFNYSSYIAGDTPVHRMDPRAKLALLLAYILALFFIREWPGFAFAAVLALLVLGLSRLDLRMMARLLSPAFALAVLLLVFNCFTYVPLAQGQAVESSIGLLQIAGPLHLNLEGLETGAFFGIRVLLLVLASLVVGLTTTSTELSSVASWVLAPLRRLGLPVDDVASMFSIALRFIPLMAEEFCRIRNAQWARGCGLEDEGLVMRLKAWVQVLIPMILSLFRKADALSEAMDARCYGAVERRASLVQMKLDAYSAAGLVLGLAFCVALAFCF